MSYCELLFSRCVPPLLLLILAEEKCTVGYLFPVTPDVDVILGSVCSSSGIETVLVSAAHVCL